MKKTIAVFLFLILVFAGSALAWPWGNVGLNVDEPKEQLDVGGNLLVRSNVVIRGLLQLGDDDIPDFTGILTYDPASGRYVKFGNLNDNVFCFGYEDGPYYGFRIDGMIGGVALPPWYSEEGGPEWGNAVESTNRASIRISYNPPGFIFNVNGVIWTNTP